MRGCEVTAQCITRNCRNRQVILEAVLLITKSGRQGDPAFGLYFPVPGWKVRVSLLLRGQQTQLEHCLNWNNQLEPPSRPGADIARCTLLLL